MTALHLAALHGNLEILEMLCNHKAICNQEGTYGRTPLHLVVEKEEIGNVMCTLHLLKAVSWHISLKFMTSNLTCKSSNKTNEINSYRYQAGDSDTINIQNYRGDTALHCAASLGHTKLCALLLHFGSDLNIENYIRPSSEDGDEEEQNGQTALQVAANDEVNFNFLKI